MCDVLLRAANVLVRMNYVLGVRKGRWVPPQPLLL